MALRGNAVGEWNAQQYLKFEDERTRPAQDLLARVPATEVNRAVDAGCGPGNSTELLVRRYPGTVVSGLDSSSDMLRRARQRLPQCEFVQADLADWSPDADVDLVFANAAYQWVPNHLSAMRRVVEKLQPGGVLAVQMPDNTREPSHLAMTDISWRLGVPEGAREDLPDPHVYYDALRPVCSHLEIWHTIYNHAVTDASAIAEWFRGSAMRPFLEGLDEERRREMLDAYIDEIRPQYPPRVDRKVLLRFPRLFLIAVR